jgi:hypothetical protein
MFTFTNHGITARKHMMLFQYNKFILFFIKSVCFYVISGGNRYIPAGGSGGPSPVDVTDPFTGASRYVPSHRSGVSDSVTSVYFIFSFEN